MLLFSRILCFPCFLLYCCHKHSKDTFLEIHISSNVFSFLSNIVLCMHFAFFRRNKLKYTQNTRFLVILFLHEECFTGVLAFWYVSSSKNIQKHLFGNIVLFSYIGCFTSYLACWCLIRWITHKRHVSGNVVSFPHVGALHTFWRFDT